MIIMDQILFITVFIMIVISLIDIFVRIVNRIDYMNIVIIVMMSLK